MKFMTIASFKDTFYTLPKDEQKELLVEGVQWVVDLKKKMGDRFVFYHSPGWNRQISIGRYEDLETYNESLQSPISNAGFMSYESYPLIELDDHKLDSYLQAAKKST